MLRALQITPVVMMLASEMLGAQPTAPPETLVVDFGVDFFGAVPANPLPWAEFPGTKLADRVKEFWSVPADLENAKGHIVAAMTLDERGTVSGISIVEPASITALNTVATDALAHLNPTPLLAGELPREATQLTVAIFWNEASQPEPIPAPPDWPPPGALRPGGGVTLPQLVHEEKPKYTRLAMKGRIQGRVLTEVVVQKNGTVGRAIIVQSLDRTFGLDAEALSAVQQWTFKPGTRMGEPADVVVSIELTFTLK